MKSLSKAVLIILAFLPLVMHSQMYQKKKLPLMTFDGTYKMQHFYISPGLTYMLPNEVEKLGGNNNDSINARGRIGFMLEAGAYYIFQNGGNIFNYMDYGLGYKKLSGSEIANSQDKAIFKQHYLSLNYNLNNVYQLADTRFLQSSIGLNTDYKLFEKDSPSPENTDRLLFSMHLKIGYGMKFQNRLFIIPSIETPIVNFKKWDNGKSTYGIFNSRYRPLLFKIRILWLKRPSRGECPPVYLNPEDKARYERNYMQ